MFLVTLHNSGPKSIHKTLELARDYIDTLKLIVDEDYVKIVDEDCVKIVEKDFELEPLESYNSNGNIKHHSPIHTIWKCKIKEIVEPQDSEKNIVEEIERLKFIDIVAVTSPSDYGDFCAYKYTIVYKNISCSGITQELIKIFIKYQQSLDFRLCCSYDYYIDF